MQVTIDPHILKKVATNLKKIDESLKKASTHFIEVEKLHSENKALLEFVQGVCNKEGGKDNGI